MLGQFDTIVNDLRVSLKDMGKQHQGMMKHVGMKGHDSMMDKGHQQHGNPGSGMK
jgi:hypothetical protein